jgi:hypothetical protein
MKKFSINKFNYNNIKKDYKFNYFDKKINNNKIFDSNNIVMKFTEFDNLINKLNIQSENTNENIMCELKELNTKLDNLMDFLKKSNLNNMNSNPDIDLEVNLLKKTVDYKISKIYEEIKYKYINYPYGIFQKDITINKIQEIQNNLDNDNLDNDKLKKLDINNFDDNCGYDYIKKIFLI